MTEPKCKSCGVPMAEHLTLEDTCAMLKELTQIVSDAALAERVKCDFVEDPAASCISQPCGEFCRFCAANVFDAWLAKRWAGEEKDDE